MFIAIWILGAHVLRSGDRAAKLLAGGGILLVFPICLLSIFFGLGTPPGAMQEWITTAAEQKMRFDILLADGIIVALGLSIVKLLVNERGEKDRVL